MLWFMLQRDEVAVVVIDRSRELWDLAERGVRRRAAARPRARRWPSGTAVASGPSASPDRPGRSDRAEPTYVRDAGEPAVVEGVRGKWRVEPALLDGLDGWRGGRPCSRRSTGW